MTLPFDKRLTTPPHVLVRQMEGESVLLHLDQERYYGLDEVGTRMYVTLASADSIEQAYDQLLSEYQVDPEALRKDVEALAEQLLAQGLVELSED